jgi:hypothetical protein
VDAFVFHLHQVGFAVVLGLHRHHDRASGDRDAEGAVVWVGVGGQLRLVGEHHGDERVGDDLAGVAVADLAGDESLARWWGQVAAGWIFQQGRLAGGDGDRKRRLEFRRRHLDGLGAVADAGEGEVAEFVGGGLADLLGAGLVGVGAAHLGVFRRATRNRVAELSSHATRIPNENLVRTASQRRQCADTNDKQRRRPKSARHAGPRHRREYPESAPRWCSVSRLVRFRPTSTGPVPTRWRTSPRHGTMSDD